MSAPFDFKKSVAYDDERKRRFHQNAQRQLLKLAEALGLAAADFDLRSNAGGIAVSGEITLHADWLYVQACQSPMGFDSGILFRSCEGRRDYTGGRNHFASLDLLHDPEELAALIRRHIRQPEAAATPAEGAAPDTAAPTARDKLSRAALDDQFTGSEHWYRHGLVRGILYTDGAKYVADTGGAHWLLDEIAFAQRFQKKVAAEEFQVWKLRVQPDQTAMLSCEDGNGHTVFEKALEYTDFPAEEIELWFENSTIYLPSEH